MSTVQREKDSDAAVALSQLRRAGLCEKEVARALKDGEEWLACMFDKKQGTFRRDPSTVLILRLVLALGERHAAAKI